MYCISNIKTKVQVIEKEKEMLTRVRARLNGGLLV